MAFVSIIFFLIIEMTEKSQNIFFSNFSNFGKMGQILENWRL